MRIAGLAALLLASLAPIALAGDLSRSATGDIDGDGVPDRVEIEPNGAGLSTVDVTVHLSASERVVQVRSIAAAEFVATPKIDAQGKVHLSFGWTSGRTKTLTDFRLGLQSRDLVVERYRRGAGETERCDVDFIAGRATHNDAPAPIPGRAVALAAWTSEAIPPPAVSNGSGCKATGC